MRLKRTQSVLKELGIEYRYGEQKGLGKITIHDNVIYEHYINPNRKTINFMANEINMITETQLIGWIRNNRDRLKYKNYRTKTKEE